MFNLLKKRKEKRYYKNHSIDNSIDYDYCDYDEYEDDEEYEYEDEDEDEYDDYLDDVITNEEFKNSHYVWRELC